jgi:hypothetical protein
MPIIRPSRAFSHAAFRAVGGAAFVLLAAAPLAATPTRWDLPPGRALELARAGWC